MSSNRLLAPCTLDAAELLASRGIDARVLSMPTIKPLDVSSRPR